MKFSILVPVYNVEKYLEQCVESLLNQTYQGEYEIILVDDGSTDLSGEICDRYANNYFDKVKVIHKDNGGHTSARLEAIKNANGEYSFFCDSDDFIEPDLLNTVGMILDRIPDADVINFSFSYYENSSKKPRRNEPFDDETVCVGDNKKLLYELLISTPLLNSLCTKAINTQLLKSKITEFDIIKDKAIAEDAYMVTEFITAAKKIVCINEPLYNYRTNPESISRSYRVEAISKKNMLFLYKRFLELLPLWGMDDIETRKKVNLACLNNVMYLFSNFYKNAGSIKERNTVLHYAWSDMLTDDLCKNHTEYRNCTSGRLYSWLKQKQYFSIWWYFFKIKTYKKIKGLIKRLR